MAVTQIALDHYRQRAVLAREAADALSAVWARVDRNRIAESWAASLPAVVRVFSAVQQEAAGRADSYVRSALVEQRIPASTGLQLAPGAFSGIASDGRDLESLLYQPAITTLTALRSGRTLDEAMTAGRFDLDMITRTQVADAGRVADGVAIVGQDQAQGYTRALSPPSCSRCIVLSGRFYRWNAGFDRHPRCDCVHVPGRDPRGIIESPRKAFDSMTRDEQDRAFTRAGARAIRDGADVAQVVNSRRGMFTAGGRRLTTESTSRRGVARRGRLMPEQIYEDSGGDRDKALRLLRSNGYLVDARRTAPTRPTVPRQRRPAPAVQPATFDQRIAGAAKEGDALASARFGLDRSNRPEAFTPEMAHSVNTYTGAEYAAINRHLRGQPLPYGYTAADVTPTIRDLDTALAASTLAGDATAYRGIRNARDMFGDRVDSNLTGLEWREEAYVSTTVRERKAVGFAGQQPTSMVMRILTPKGTQAIEASGMDLEGELLLRRGLRLRVVADRGVAPSGVRYVDVEVLRG